MRRQLTRLLIVSLTLSVYTNKMIAEEPPADLLIEDSFETGTNVPDGWKQGAAVPGVKYVYDQKVGSDGKRSLSLRKSEKRYFPIAGWSRSFKHESKKPALNVAVKVKASKATKAVVDVQFLDAEEAMLSHEWIAYIGQKQPTDPLATHAWKVYSGGVEIPDGAKQIRIDLQIYGPGEVWFDELAARYVDSVDEEPKKNDSKDSAAQSLRGPTSPDVPSPIEIPTASGGIARFLLIPASDDASKPNAGYPLIVVLPGGDGSAEFHPFVNSIHKQALGGRFVVAQVLAPPQIVWPTKSSTTRWGTTGESIAAIVEDVAKRQPIDRQQVYALAWSSSGPAVYETILQAQTPLAGAFIAMSVFKPNDLPPLTAAKGRRVYLLHSPADAVCPYRMAQDAKQQLTAAGAEVTLVDYAGGHGWHGPVHDTLRAGLDWLQRPTRK